LRHHANLSCVTEDSCSVLDCEDFLLHWAKHLPKYEQFKQTEQVTTAQVQFTQVRAERLREAQRVLREWASSLKTRPQSSVCVGEEVSEAMKELERQWKRGLLPNLLPVLEFTMWSLIQPQPQEGPALREHYPAVCVIHVAQHCANITPLCVIHRAQHCANITPLCVIHMAQHCANITPLCVIHRALHCANITPAQHCANITLLCVIHKAQHCANITPLAQHCANITPLCVIHVAQHCANITPLCVIHRAQHCANITPLCVIHVAQHCANITPLAQHCANITPLCVIHVAQHCANITPLCVIHMAQHCANITPLAQHCANITPLCVIHRAQHCANITLLCVIHKALCPAVCDLRVSKDCVFQGSIPQLWLKSKQRFRHTVDIKLDPETSHPDLRLSADRKRVKMDTIIESKYGPRDGHRRSPHKYDGWWCVQGSEGFTEGRHYWEVGVRGKAEWRIGVVKESAYRRGFMDLNTQSGYWTLRLQGCKLKALTVPATEIPLPQPPSRLGVHLDMEEGQLSFYDVERSCHIYTFNNDFDEKVYPLFGTVETDREIVILQ
ncbi:hypothetical protein JZ751_027058, partial [Albula glossodonta]